MGFVWNHVIQRVSLVQEVPPIAQVVQMTGI